MPKKILVALDGSPRAKAVLRYGESLARLMDAKLVLFRAFEISPELTLAWPDSDRTLEAALRTQANRYLRECARKVPPELVAEVRVAKGIPWKAISAAARAANVDLVLVGSHGYGGIDRLLGTTAAKIVNHVDRPVLVFRPIPKPSRG